MAWVKEEKRKTIYLLRRRETETSERNPCPFMSHLLLCISVCLCLSQQILLSLSLSLSLSFPRSVSLSEFLMKWWNFIYKKFCLVCFWRRRILSTVIFQNPIQYPSLQKSKSVLKKWKWRACKCFTSYTAWSQVNPCGPQMPTVQFNGTGNGIILNVWRNESGEHARASPVISHDLRVNPSGLQMPTV